MLKQEPPLYLCFRPEWAGGLPAPLAHPVFGHFLDEAADPALITRRDCTFVQEFCDISLRFYKKEEDRQGKLWPLLSAYLGVDLQEFVAVVPGGQAISAEDLVVACRPRNCV